MRFVPAVSVIILLFACSGTAQQSESFPPIEQWKAAVISGDAVALKSLYSVSPAAVINTTSGKASSDAAVAYWISLKARNISLKAVEAGSPRADLQAFTLQATVKSATGQTTKFVEGQTWQNQAGVWRIVGEKRDLAKLEQPATVNAHIYPTGDARQEIHDAIARAGREHKNVLLVFGADWCYDCHVLDKAFRRPDIAAVFNPNYELVNVDIGEGDKNLDVAVEYQVPLNRGVPAAAVLDSTGKLLYSQKNGDWERARALAPQDLLEFLNKWKPQSR
jgi:thiol:disulfide interchange protein